MVVLPLRMCRGPGSAFSITEQKHRPTEEEEEEKRPGDYGLMHNQPQWDASVIWGTASSVHVCRRLEETADSSVCVTVSLQGTVTGRHSGGSLS